MLSAVDVGVLPALGIDAQLERGTLPAIQQAEAVAQPEFCPVSDDPKPTRGVPTKRCPTGHPVTEVCEDARRMLGCCGLSARSSSPGPAAPPVACPPHEGATRAVKLSGVEGVGSKPDTPRSRNPSASCTSSIRTSADRPSDGSDTTRPLPSPRCVRPA